MDVIDIYTMIELAGHAPGLAGRPAEANRVVRPEIRGQNDEEQ